jgi:hypothetical protein
VLATLGAILLALWAYDGTQALSTIRYVAHELAHIAPWLAGSVMIAAAARATGADALAARAFTGRQSRMIVMASFIGALLPFCSCGVIPLVAGLLGSGVPLAPVMAFWIASPLMDPTQFLVASGVLGLGFATAKIIAAVGMGLLSGFGTMTLIRVGWLNEPEALRIAVTGPSSCCGSKKPGIGSPIVWRFWAAPERLQLFLSTAGKTGWFLLRWLAVAYALESVMLAWLPVNTVGDWLGSGAGLLAVPVAVLIGIPVYLNSLAAIPFISGLINLGMSPATGLAFMLASSATGFPAMVAVWAFVKPRAFTLYIGFAVMGALIAGYTYSAALAAGL